MTPGEVARRSAAALWSGDLASQGLGMRLVEVAPGRATVAMRVGKAMVNGHAVGHGGFTFTLADSAFAFACNSYNRATLAAACEIRFVAPTRLGDDLVAVATERSRTGREGVYDVTVRAGERVVAQMVGRSREVRGVLFDDEDEG